jgi:hypothetical protein
VQAIQILMASGICYPLGELPPVSYSVGNNALTATFNGGASGRYVIYAAFKKFNLLGPSAS